MLRMSKDEYIRHVTCLIMPRAVPRLPSLTKQSNAGHICDGYCPAYDKCIIVLQREYLAPGLHDIFL